MEKITFKRQVTDCAVLMALGVCLTLVFHKHIIWQICMVICGQMFTINPVCPPGMQGPKMPLVMRLAGLAITVLAVVLHFAIK